MAFNKKGQEGFSLTTLLVIILGAVALIVVILGFTGGFNFIFSKVDIIPGGDYDTYIIGCTTAAQTGGRLEGSYCRDFKQIDLPGFGERVTNCEHPLVEEEVKKTESDVPECADNEGIDFCLRLKQNSDFDKDTLVYDAGLGDFIDCQPLRETGGETCGQTGTDLAEYEWVEGGCQGSEDKTYLVSDMANFNSNRNSRCCLGD